MKNKLTMEYNAKDLNDLSLKFINTLKGYITLSPKETEVLSYLLSLHLTETKEFDKTIKTNIQNYLSISNYSLNNYIKTLKDKGLLEYSTRGNLRLASIFKQLSTLDKSIEITFKFTL